MQQTKVNKTESPTPASTAQALFAQRGLRLTRVRRTVLEFLLNARVPVKAYDILDALRRDAPKALTPASIYRALDYLLQEGLCTKLARSTPMWPVRNAAQSGTRLFLCWFAPAAEKVGKLMTPLCTRLFFQPCSVRVFSFRAILLS